MKYKKGDTFYVVTFEMPDKWDKEGIAEAVLKCFGTSCNVKVIPAEIKKREACLIKDLDNFGSAIYNPREVADIKKNRRQK